MKIIYHVEKTCDSMRLDRYLRTKISSIPQSLIEKNFEFIIVFIQTQRLFHEFSFHGSDEKPVTAYDVYRERYLDLLTFCKTHNIFSVFTQRIEDILNKKQIPIQKIFDSIVR